MTPDVDARTQFRQAIAGRNVPLADRAARRAQLSLDLAVEYVLLLAEAGDERFPRASDRLLRRLVEAGASAAAQQTAADLLALVRVDVERARVGLMAICRPIEDARRG